MEFASAATGLVAGRGQAGAGGVRQSLCRLQQPKSCLIQSIGRGLGRWISTSARKTSSLVPATESSANSAQVFGISHRIRMEPR